MRSSSLVPRSWSRVEITNRQSKLEIRNSAVGNRRSASVWAPSRVPVIDSTLTYSTYLGGSGADGAFGIALDANGNAYVTGHANLTNFPVSSGSLHSASGVAPDVFVTELNTDGSALVYST